MDNMDYQRKRNLVVDMDSMNESEEAADGDSDVHKKLRRVSPPPDHNKSDDDDDKQEQDVQQSMMDFVIMTETERNSFHQQQGQPTTTTTTDDGSTRNSIDDITIQQEEEEVSSVISSCTKALATIEIIENIAKYLKPTDLTNLRLTSKTWNKALIPQLKKRHTFIHLNDDNMTEPWYSKKSAWKYFINYIHETNEILFRRYHIDGISFNKFSIGYFFGKCGVNITCLQITIYDDITLSLSIFRNIIFNATPYLQELIIEDERELVGDEDERLRWIPFWQEGSLCNNDEFPKELLSSLTLKRFEMNGVIGGKWKGFIRDLVDAPCLHELMVNTRGAEDNDVNFISDFIAALEEKAELQKLKILDLEFLSNSGLRRLIDLSRRESNKLVLTDMRLIVPVPPTQEVLKSLQQLLMLQSNSLLALDLYFNGDETTTVGSIKLLLPKMVNLKTMTLNLSINEEEMTLESFLNNFPKLTKFEYGYFECGHLQFEEVAAAAAAAKPVQNSRPNDPHTTLQKLFVHDIDDFDKLERLGTLFPCITKLFIALVDLELLCNVWTTPWVQLQTLKVGWRPRGSAEQNLLETSSMADEYLTGIPHEDHSTILKLINGGYPIVDLNLMKTKPGLTDMKSLRKLQLDLGVSLTDISAYYGFGYPSTNLTSIYICKADQITATCRELIQNKLGPTVNIQYGD